AAGRGLAPAAVLGAVPPALLVTWLAVRAAAFALSPGPPSMVTPEAPKTGAFLDFARLVRLERLMQDTRSALRARFPTLPPGSGVGQHSFPLSPVYALGGDHALQEWYRHTTGHWVHLQDYPEHPMSAVVTPSDFH